MFCDRMKKEELLVEYKRAHIFILPSLFEGMSNSLLEAMACGCPVVTSKISSLPEIAGNAALLVDPYSVDDIARGITKILTNPILKSTMVKRGFKQVDKFSWGKTISETVKIYQSIFNPAKILQGVTLGKHLGETKGILMKYILKLFILWNLALLLVYFIVSSFIPQRKQFSYNDGPGMKPNPVFLWHRANFDGIHYIDIAKKGYSINQQAFFPLYPKLIKAVSPLFGGRLLISGITISLLSTIIALWFFYRLVQIDYSEKIAKRTLLLWLIFPTSFFLGSVYTEGLFVALLLGSFYSARIGKWWAAGLLGMLAANTRIVGVLIFPAIIYEFYCQRMIYCQIGQFGAGFRTNLGIFVRKLYCLLQPVKGYVPLFLIPLGLVFYMRYLQVNYQDPLMFLHVQPNFGGGRSDGQMILLYQVFWRYFKMILTTRLDPLYIVVWLELLTGISAIALIILSFRQRIRTSYLIFSITAFLLPTLTGTFLSLPRFVLCLFPLFISLALIENKLIRWVINVVFCLLFIVYYAMFSRGFWIA